MNIRAGRTPAEFRVTRADETVREKTVERLREAIINQYFQPGARLIERELCELTGVSRTTIREALRQLESEGLVDVVPQRGPVVASLRPEDARNIYELREALEAYAARLFVERATGQDIALLEEAAERCIAAIASRDVGGTIQAIDEFTTILFEGGGNPLIASMMRTLRHRLHFLRAATTPRQDDAQIRESLRNLRRIVACVRKRDADGAAEACVARVRHAASVALNLLDEQPPEADRGV
jgi:GntR family transcriptional regulator, trigonelline degradation regulator